MKNVVVVVKIVRIMKRLMMMGMIVQKNNVRKIV
jgi:hypothetical protein